jgi:pimeloyl-ACP methyl ester carboxylesterase
MLIWTLAAAVGGALLVDRAALMTLRPPSRGPERDAAEFGHPCTPIAVESGGFAIRGDLIEPVAATGSAPIAVLVHGWTGTASVMLTLAEPLLEAGQPVVAFDVRSHGRSERAPAVTVRHFRDDLMRVVEHVREIRPGRRVAVVGHSLGGAAGILACARGAPIDGLALMAAPADLFETTASFFSDRGLPGGFLTRLFHPSWRLRAGESFRGLDPEARARELGESLPVTIVQGGQDTRVPPAQAQRLARALGTAVVLVPDAGHRDILTAAPAHDELIRFLGSLPG